MLPSNLLLGVMQTVSSSHLGHTPLKFAPCGMTSSDEVAGLKSAQSRDAASFRNAMERATNCANQVDAGLARIREQFQHNRKLGLDLVKAAGNIKGIDDNTQLRLKDHRLKPFASDSALKNIFGIGKAQRVSQALALKECTGGADTRASLKALYKDQVNAEVNASSRLLDTKRSELANLIQTVQNHISRADHRAANASACSQQGLTLFSKIEADALAGVRAGKAEPVLAPAVKAYLAHASRHYFNIMDGQRRELKKQLHPEGDSRSSAQPASSFNQRMSATDVKLIIDKQNDLMGKDNSGKDMFAAVWVTNKGSRAVNEMARGLRQSLDGATVIADIERQNGSDTFTHGEKAVGKALKAYASALTPNDVHAIAINNHKLSLSKLANGQASVGTTYRQAMHSRESIDLWRSLAGTGKILRPQQFMATASNETDTHQYPVVPAASGTSRVQFIISGFSAIPLHSRYAPRGEVFERVYTHQTGFEVVSVHDRSDGIAVVRLKEVPVSLAELKSASLLTL